MICGGITTDGRTIKRTDDGGQSLYFCHDKCIALFLMRMEAQPWSKMGAAESVFTETIDRMVDNILKREGANASGEGREV
jgi:hypothetical protein